MTHFMYCFIDCIRITRTKVKPDAEMQNWACSAVAEIHQHQTPVINGEIRPTSLSPYALAIIANLYCLILRNRSRFRGCALRPVQPIAVGLSESTASESQRF